jgi:hypothetical protein
MITLRFAATMCAALLTTGVAAAQTTPVRVRGQIEAISEKTVTVKAREGNTVQINLTEPVTVMALTAIDIAEVKSNSFVGIASLKGTDGKHYALEVLVFPENMRGAGEGHYPWDLKPESMMTNATVAALAAAPKGRVLTLKYKQSEEPIEITVPPEAPIVTFAPGPRELLKAGNHIMTTTQKAADGTLSTGRVTVGVNGLVPPM